MGEQTYLNMKVLVIIVSQRYMLYWTDWHEQTFDMSKVLNNGRHLKSLPL